LSAVAREEERRYPVFDGHVDLLHSLKKESFGVPFHDLRKGSVTGETLEKGGVRTFLSALYIPDSSNGPDLSVRYLRNLLNYSKTYVETSLKWFDSTAALKEISSDVTTRSFLFLLENADPLVEFGVPSLVEQGVAAVGLTHNGRNRIADGCRVPSPTGLTDVGRKIVLQLDRAGIAVDVAHLSHPAFDEVLDLIESPPIASHTGLRAFHDSPRNLTDEQVERIIERGGVVGLCAAPEMLVSTGGGTIDDLFWEIDYLVQKFGPSGIGIGSDFGGFSGSLLGMEDHTCFPVLASLMENNGYPPETVAGIVGENWRRFFTREFRQG